MAKKREKTKKTLNLAAWLPVMIIFGFIIGFFICWLTFSHLGGN